MLFCPSRTAHNYMFQKDLDGGLKMVSMGLLNIFMATCVGVHGSMK